jgi:ribosomal protein L7Ae-like RNA K-turn-binding protein
MDALEMLRNNADFVVGTRETLRGLTEGKVLAVLLASDADMELKAKVRRAAAKAGVPVTLTPSMKELGAEAGIKLSAACVSIIRGEEV